MWFGLPTFKIVHVTLTTLDIAYPCTKFSHSLSVGSGVSEFWRPNCAVLHRLTPWLIWLYFAWMTRWREMYIGHARASVCVSVCLTVCPSPKLLHGPRCNFGELQGVPPSCALLDVFAIGAPFSLLSQHSAELALCLVTKFEVPIVSPGPKIGREP